MNLHAHRIGFALSLSLLSATGWLSACASTNANNAQAQARVHTELAARYYQAGQVAVAVQEAQIALDSDAGYVPGHTLLALIYAQLRQNAQADAHFRQALSLSEAQRLPTSDLRNSYAWYLCQTDRMAQGLNELSPVLRDPLYGSLDKALVNASVCAARMGQYELADSYVNAALAQKLLGDALETPETLWLLARIEHGSSNRRTGAAERLQKQFPASQEAKWLRAEQWQWF